jgi:hypothetical protein
MDEVIDKCRTSSTKDSKQAILQTTFGLVTLNHFGISVRDLDRSIAFYQALTGQEPASTGNWSSTGLGSATGIGDSSSSRRQQPFIGLHSVSITSTLTLFR